MESIPPPSASNPPDKAPRDGLFTNGEQLAYVLAEYGRDAAIGYVRTMQRGGKYARSLRRSLDLEMQWGLKRQSH